MVVLLEELQRHLSIGLDHCSHGVLLCRVINDVYVDAIIVSLGNRKEKKEEGEEDVEDVKEAKKEEKVKEAEEEEEENVVVKEEE